MKSLNGVLPQGSATFPGKSPQPHLAAHPHVSARNVHSINEDLLRVYYTEHHARTRKFSPTHGNCLPSYVHNFLGHQQLSQSIPSLCRSMLFAVKNLFYDFQILKYIVLTMSFLYKIQKSIQIICIQLITKWVHPCNHHPAEETEH